MRDRYNREIEYMRISVTDRCNLRCYYCMPKEGVPWIPMEEILTFEEIQRVCEIAAGLGIRKIKLTGGEPLVRKGISSLVQMLMRTPGIEEVTMTTNGVTLAEHIEELKRAGLSAVNVSLDTLKADEFAHITGIHALDLVLQGIDAAYESGIPVKVNAVLRPDCDWRGLAGLARDRRIHVRFIELMPIGEGKKHDGLSADKLLRMLSEEYPGIQKDPASYGNGPAEYYKLPEYAGSIGIIHAMHGKFCGSCNRIRMSSTGEIKPCLCYKGTLDLRRELREGSTESIRNTIKQAILDKPAAHCFEELQEITEENRMSAIGG